jgi:hypothetical protein
MPVEEPRRKRKRGIEEPDRYPEPKRETKPQIVPPGFLRALDTFTDTY